MANERLQLRESLRRAWPGAAFPARATADLDDGGFAVAQVPGGPTASIAVEPPRCKSQAQTRSARNRQRLNLSTKRLRDRTRPACSRRASIHDRTPSRLRYGASGPLVTERGTDAIRPARP